MRYDLLFNRLKINPSKIFQTAFIGDNKIARDNETIWIMEEIFKTQWVGYWFAQWENLEHDFSQTKIFLYGRDKNRRQRWESEWEIWWTSSETFFDTWKSHNLKYWKYCHPNCDCWRFIEIGNSVFMQYVMESSERKKMDSHNIDFWWWLERILLACSVWISNIFLTDAYIDNIILLEKLTWVDYVDNLESFEIIVDHVKSISFLIKDWCRPWNKEQWYFLRRLIRRLSVRLINLNILNSDTLKGLIKNNAKIYTWTTYSFDEHEDEIYKILSEEANKFKISIQKLDWILDKLMKSDISVDAKLIFELKATHWIPTEISIERVKSMGFEVDEVELIQYVKDHENISRQWADTRFKL